MWNVSKVEGRSYFTNDGQSVSTSWYRAPLWGLRLDITSYWNVAVWNLRSCFCGRPLWLEDRSAICNVITQWSESRRIRNSTLLAHLRLPQPGGPGSHIYIHQEQGGPVIPSGHWIWNVSTPSLLLYSGAVSPHPTPKPEDPLSAAYNYLLAATVPKVESVSQSETRGRTMPWR
jgi:hypothetical protein